MIAHRRPALVGGFALLVFVLALAVAGRFGFHTPLFGRIGNIPKPPLVVLRTASGEEQQGERGTYG